MSKFFQSHASFIWTVTVAIFGAVFALGSQYMTLQDDHHKIDTLEQISYNEQKSLIVLDGDVKVLSTKVDEQGKQVDKLEGRVEELSYKKG